MGIPLGHLKNLLALALLTPAVGSRIAVLAKLEQAGDLEDFVGKGSMRIGTWYPIDFGWNNKDFAERLRKDASPRFKKDTLTKVGEKVLADLKPKDGEWVSTNESLKELTLSIPLQKKYLYKAKLVQLWWQEGRIIEKEGVEHMNYKFQALVLELF